MKSIYLLPGGFNSFVSYAFVYLFFLFYAFFVVFSPFYPLYALILMIPLPYLNDIDDRLTVHSSKSHESWYRSPSRKLPLEQLPCL